ncbi:MAG: YegS/Rv2252/BmrU family lipid kinase [Ginsengibacter sp.]
MPRRILYFINPISGPRRKLPIEKLISEKTRGQKIPFEILHANQSGDYPFLRDKVESEKITDVVICGGDGTVNQVAGALVDVDVNIGIIPLGSGNGLAFTAGIPRNPHQALEIIFANKSAFIDAFFIDERFCCMLCGVGFDAQVAHDFAGQKTRGLVTYIRQTLKNFIIAPTYPFDITIKGHTFNTDAFFISIANSNQFGNNLKIAPRASLDDGLLDIVIVKKMSKIKLLWAVLQQIRSGEPGNHDDKNFHKNEVVYFQSDKVIIHNPSLAPLHIDGEPMSTNKKFDIQILPGAFKLLKPLKPDS